MTVIKADMISDRVTRHDLLPLSFLDRSPYTGSKGKLRYRIEKRGEGADRRLLVSSWMTPLAYAHTPAEDISEAEFDFSDAGIDDIISYLNSLSEEPR